MGTVFLAYDNSLRRRVALKVLGESTGDASRSQLLREARSSAALNHPGICTVYEIGDGFIAMEYVDGRPLSVDLNAGALPPATAITYAIQAADALAFAHQHAVVHRDFKAANIIVTASGRLKVIDFGLARHGDGAMSSGTTVATAVPAGAMAGTPYAMAPEQVRGEPADARTDIWALGILLYEMIAGAKPFHASTVAELFSSILRDSPPPLPSTVPIALRAVVDRCLAKEPGLRYQGAAEVRAALEAIQAGTRPGWAALPYLMTRRRAIALAIVVIAAVSAVGIPAVRERLTGAVSPIRLAVLPFTNLTGDRDQDFFSDGLTEETISQLGRLQSSRLSVIARTSSMQYKNRAIPVTQIGRELGVEYLLEGSARREANRVRVTTTLVRVSDQSQRWTDSFERDVSGIMGLQNDVAKGVAQALAVALLPDERARLETSAPVDVVAYDNVLRGRSHVVKLTRGDLDAALQYFQVALDRNPNYAPALVGVAQVWSGRQQIGLAPSSEAAPPMKAAIAKAVALDDSSSDAHLRLAIQYTWTDWQWPEGEREFQRAIALGPNNSEAHAFYGHYLHIMRRPAEGAAEMRRAIELDPLSELIQALNGTMLLWNGRNDDAVTNARNILRTTPDSNQALNQLGIALYNLGRFDEALVAEKQWAHARGDTELESELAKGAAEAGYPGAMRHEADLLAVRALKRAGPSNRIALAYVRTGQKDRAIEWLQRGVAARDPNMPYLNTNPHYVTLRTDPRFVALLRQMKLPE